MPTERLAMRHVREVMRLRAAGMPSREIARRVGAAPSTVRLTIRRFEASGLSWPLPDDVTDTVLEARLFAKAGSGSRQGQRRLAGPDWAAVHRELKRKHVTLSIVWEEYIAGEPGGYRYSRFCELYRAWEGRLSVTMRQCRLGLCRFVNASAHIRLIGALLIVNSQPLRPIGMGARADCCSNFNPVVPRLNGPS
jgi:hypothetical protein